MENFTKKKAFLYLAGIEGCTWAALACYSYLTVFLNKEGFSVTQVGLINTLMSAVAVVSGPAVGTMADRLKSSRKAYVICASMMGLAALTVPLAAQIKVAQMVLIVVCITIHRIFYQSTSPMMESTVIIASNKTGNDYGRIRTIGTVAWVIMCLILGSTISESNVNLTFFVSFFAVIPAIFLATKIKTLVDRDIDEKKDGTKKKKVKLPYKKLFSNPYFVAYLIYNVCYQIPNMCVMTYLPYLIREVGGNMAFIGYIQAYRASFEIPTLMFATKIQKKISLKNMVITSGVLVGLQCLLYGTAKTFPQVILYTTLAGLASGFNIAGSVKYVFTLSPIETRSTAQTTSGACMAVAGIIGHALGTLIVASFGIRFNYTINGIIILIVVTLFIFSFSFIKNVLHTEYIDYSKQSEEEPVQ